MSSRLDGGGILAGAISHRLRRPASAQVSRRGGTQPPRRRRRPISANPRLKHKGDSRVESKEATQTMNPYMTMRRRPASANPRLVKRKGKAGVTKKKRIGWRRARPKTAAFDRHLGPNEVEALKEKIQETKMENQRLLVDRKASQAMTRRLRTELNKADHNLESVLTGGGSQNLIFSQTIRQMRKMRVKVHELQLKLAQRDTKIEALVTSERQSRVMELEVENEEFYGQIVHLRAALQQRDEMIRKEQFSSLATVEASYRLADEVTSLQTVKEKLEEELLQTRAQLDRAMSITNKEGNTVSVFDLIEELQAKVRVQKKQNAKLQTELQRFRSYFEAAEEESPPTEKRKRKIKV